MSKNKTEKSKWESRYGGGFVTPAQYIAEVICERLAKKDRLVLSEKFWNKEPWKTRFLLQIRTIHSLLNVYDASAIIAVLSKDKFKHVYSLRYKPLQEAFDLEIQQRKIKEQALKEQLSKIETKPPEIFNREVMKNKSLKNRLDELED